MKDRTFAEILKDAEEPAPLAKIVSRGNSGGESLTIPPEIVRAMQKDYEDSVNPPPVELPFRL